MICSLIFLFFNNLKRPKQVMFASRPTKNWFRRLRTCCEQTRRINLEENKRKIKTNRGKYPFIVSYYYVNKIILQTLRPVFISVSKLDFFYKNTYLYKKNKFSTNVGFLSVHRDLIHIQIQQHFCLCFGIASVQFPGTSNKNVTTRPRPKSTSFDNCT